MAAITTADVTYTPLGGGTATTGPTVAQEVSAPGRVRRQFKLTLPNGTTGSDYPAGGVPLLKGAMGAPKFLVSLKVMGQTPIAGDTNFMWQWNGDPVTPKLVAFQGGSVGTAPLRETALTGLTTNAHVIFVDVEGY